MIRSAAILLAAGASTRTGTPKQLYRVDGKALVQYQTDRLLASGISRVYVVVGHHAKRVRHAIKPSSDVRVLLNEAYTSGMFSSILTGIAALAGEDIVFIHPVDVPVPGKQVFHALSRAESTIAIPVYQGRRGHPVRLDRVAAEALLHANADRLDRWLYENEAEVSHVDVTDAKVVMNANTLEALEYCFKKGTP